MASLIRKAVFPVAGLGTRFLPATKASPKEMLPVVDKPLIQYAAEEAVAAGITELIFVTGRNKRAIEDHFDAASELELELENKGKTKLLQQVREVLPAHVNCIYIRQPQALGLGHAVLCARPAVGNEPFAVLLADDLMDGTPPILSQMTRQFDALRSSLVSVQDIPREQTSSYGVVAVTNDHERAMKMSAIVEKPAPDKAPSTLAVVGRYLLTPRIFDLLADSRPGVGGEIQLTDAISRLMQHEPVYAFRFSGKRYDCGSKIGYLKASVDFALRHEEVHEEFEAFLRQRVSELG